MTQQPTASQPGSSNPSPYIEIELRILADTGANHQVELIGLDSRATTALDLEADSAYLYEMIEQFDVNLLRTSRSGRRGHWATSSLLNGAERDFQKFGAKLFDAVIRDEVRDAYYIHRDRADTQQKLLRIKFTPEPANLAALPWEFMYDSRHRVHLCLSSDTSFVRTLDVARAMNSMQAELPLRILAVISLPRDQALDNLNVRRERELVQLALQDLTGAGIVVLEWLENPTYGQLKRKLAEQSWHILHFIGHGYFDEEQAAGNVIFVSEDQAADPISASDFGELLASNEFKFVLLNICEGARFSADDLFSSTATTLIQKRVPAVVAMQHEISDNAAIRFAQEFYESIAYGEPLDKAITSARTAIRRMDHNSLEWATPVLYMRSKLDGRLLHLDRAQIKQAKEEWQHKAAAHAAWLKRWRSTRPQRRRQAFERILAAGAQDMRVTLEAQHERARAQWQETTTELQNRLKREQQQRAEEVAHLQKQLDTIGAEAKRAGFLQALHQVAFAWERVGPEVKE